METLDLFIASFNMRKELNNTLDSCLPPYQENVSIADYTIYVIDNGSTDGTNAQEIEGKSPNIKFVSSPFISHSPVPALNWAINQFASSDFIMICIDGARILSNQILAKIFAVFSIIPNAFVYTIGFHIGEKTHMELAREGFDRTDAQSLLNSLDWLEHSDLLKQNSVYAGSSHNGYFSAISESNAFALKRYDLNRVGHFNPQFLSPGGGFCNLEIFQRLTLDPHLINICLLTEGTYHQFHEGAATSNKVGHEIFQDEYRSIFGGTYKPKDYIRFYY